MEDRENRPIGETDRPLGEVDEDSEVEGHARIHRPLADKTQVDEDDDVEAHGAIGGAVGGTIGEPPVG
jgi:hypothetical protein